MCGQILFVTAAPAYLSKFLWLLLHLGHAVDYWDGICVNFFGILSLKLQTLDLSCIAINPLDDLCRQHISFLFSYLTVKLFDNTPMIIKRSKKCVAVKGASLH